ncbi:hypothetical protein A1O1_07586 [Capronia coronata CBS 617.96]|uniref:Zn(2)-C6 fungal-type domain-containing protein n=1 Tax=Capronia coronata CBS 617.96 TaxID=1182541 RepID=W9XLX1_9EURO|nr:uncharacterized protein A1O1_07586 [Capronia coronata CBS 617.96]EXJ81522.1 hypothetical protein A1O1_07586 [Capronia coronata CBS 617.96]
MPVVILGQTRQKLRKTKTGCRTCKIRKVKCDEARPSCRRCLSTGRACDGYGIWGGGQHRASQRSSRHTDIPPSTEKQLSLQQDREGIHAAAFRHIPLHTISWDEHMCMEWFFHRSLRKLPGTFALAFWHNLLPQASVSESVVLHAVLALGSVHRRQALCDVTPTGSQGANTAESFTLQQYIRATSGLRHRIENQSGCSVKVALIVCAIFVHLEYMRGCYQTALTHLGHGMMLLEEALGKAEGGRDIVDEWIMQTFTSLLIQAKLFGQTVRQPRLLAQIEPLNDVFHSVNHARQSLEHVFFRIFSLIAENQHQHCSESGPAHRPIDPISQVNDARTTIQIELDNWLLAYKVATRSGEAAGSPAPGSALERFSWRLLHLYHTLACVMVDECEQSTFTDISSVSQSSVTSTSPSAMISHSPVSSNFSTTLHQLQCHCDSAENVKDDTVTPSFHSILAECKFLFKLVLGPSIQSLVPHRTPSDQDQSNAIADIGWIPPLYYTAIRGREADVRREAIRLLRLVPHREGIWDSLLAAAVAEKIIDVEQAACDEGLCKCEMRAQYECSEEDTDLAVQLTPGQCIGVEEMHVQLPEGIHGSLVLDYRIRRQCGNCCTQGRSCYKLSLKRWDY